MTDQSLFDEQPATPADPAANAAPAVAPAAAPQGVGTPTLAVSPEPFADLLGSIKNDRGEKKYETIPKALEGLQHAQEYIPQLQLKLDNQAEEVTRLREELAKRTAVEDVVDRLSANQQQQANQPVSLDENAVQDMLGQLLDQRDAKSIQEANVATVVNSLKESLGAEAEKAFYGKAQELGMTVAQMNLLAAQSPLAVLSYFGETPVAPQAAPTVTTGGVNTTAIKPVQQSYIGRSQAKVLVGSTSEELRAESEAAKKMVEELHNQGVSVESLTRPSEYKKYFGT